MIAVQGVPKSVAQLLALVAAFPFACLAGFGRFYEGFVFAGHALTLIPGLVGSFIRVAYYRMTLDFCHSDVHIGFGSYFAHPQASVARRVGIGAYCVLGKVTLGEGTLVASGVQILSGAQQHVRGPDGRLTDEGRMFRRIEVEEECWIGAGAMVMANLGAQVTVAAGSVVSKDVPDRAVVAGNPARVVRPPVAEVVSVE